MLADTRLVRALDVALLLLLGLLWGMTYSLTKVALTTIPPLTLVASRVCLAAAALWIVVLVLRRKVPARTMVLPIAIQGILACLVPYTLIAIGQQSVDSALASILNSMTPLFVAGWVGLGIAQNKSSPLARRFGLLLGLAGVVIVVGADALTGLGRSVTGQLMIIAATLSSAAGVLYGRRLSKLDPEAAAAGALTAAALLLVPLCVWFEAPADVAPTRIAVAALLANAVLTTALGFVLYFYLLRSVGSVRTASVSYLKPAIGVLIGCAIMAEPLTWQIIAGLIAIISGLALINRGDPWHPGAAARAQA